ncbi:MAG: polyprenyl diphosphate synthase [Promethearchaeota archaeon]
MDELANIGTIEELKIHYNDRLPKHIGIVLDGNRRWVKRQGIRDTLKGHKAGYDTLRKILNTFFDIGIQYLSIFALSTENVKKRSKREISYLFNLLIQGVQDISEEPLVHEKEVRIKVIGRINELPIDIQQSIEKVNEATQQYSNLFINICINYDGQEELLDAVKDIVRQGYKIEDISKETIKKSLYTHDFPELDYLIRTGMEDGARISGFLLWDASYAEFRFRTDLWPDYNEAMLLEDLKEYVRRNRRKGA